MDRITAFRILMRPYVSSALIDRLRANGFFISQTSTDFHRYQESEGNAMNDPVNHPAHYTTGKIEVIDFIEDKELGFHLGNAVKYIARAGKKDQTKTVEDLQKAAWYLNREIIRLNESFLKCGNCRFDKDGICYRNGYKQEQPTPGVCIRFAPIERKEIQDENN